MSLARRFGREGYQIGLISRSQEKLDGYVHELTGLKIKSLGATADVFDRAALKSAIAKIAAELGPIDVLEYSPLMDFGTLVDVLSMEVEHAQAQLDMQILGAVTSVRAVLDGMIKKGDGALLFTLGASAYSSCPSHSNGSLGVVAMKQYALLLNTALKPKGVYAGCLAIGQPPDSDEIADIYWKKVQNKGPCETLYGDPRIQACFEVLLAQGVGRVYPPGLVGKLPTPRDENEKNIFLIALKHIANCAVILNEGQAKVDEMAELAESIGGNKDAPHFGADVDKAMPKITLLA
jgi:NAD(P)-dependent dehydrogenase (short-subunit alcohol dehydrogenase family)